jgi:putative transposase
MPRRVRHELAGGFHHITARGNRRTTLFHDERDYLRFLRHLATAVERFGWFCHSLCLLPNHYHLLIETPEPNLGRGMLVINGSYARYVNWRYKLDGHAFQGPYDAEAVLDDGHLFATCRYIARNPVEAGLCDHPADWRWSSYRTTAGLDPCPPYLCVETVRDIFGSAHGFVESCNQVAEQPGCKLPQDGVQPISNPNWRLHV